MSFSPQQIDIRYGSYSESTIISVELCIPSLYGIRKINVNSHETEIIIGISPKNFTIEIYLTNDFGKILHLGFTEFIELLNNLESYFSININYIFKPPLISIFKFEDTDKYQIRFINHEKIYMKEKSLLKLCEIKKYLIIMINELENDISMYENCFREIVICCRSCIIANMSKNEIIDHLLNTSNDRIPKKILLETILNFFDYCLIYAIK